MSTTKCPNCGKELTSLDNDGECLNSMRADKKHSIFIVNFLDEPFQNFTAPDVHICILKGSEDRMRNMCPKIFRDLMADWLIQYGPDGHCDGYEKIADLAWDYFQNELILENTNPNLSKKL
jgi:hypothetical protein